MANSYWDKLTPEQRSEEMKRRQKIANGKKGHKKRQANSGVKHYTCSKCGKRFPDKYLIANHVRFHHPKKGVKHGGTQAQASAHEEDQAQHVSYIYGKVETIIEYYARSNGVPYSTLAEGVASLLRHPQSR